MSTDKYFDEEFSSLAEGLLAKYHLPGISIAVVDDDRTYSKAFGLARFPSTPATPETLWFGGSTTKAMLAATIGIAMRNQNNTENGQRSNVDLSWTTPVRSVLGEDFLVDDEYLTENITIEDSLSHRTGFQGSDLFYGPYIGPEPREVTKRLRYLGPPDKPFRTTMQYNNFMYTVAGDVLETITGQKCGEALQALLWKPLGMDRTFWHLQEAVDAPSVDTDKHLSRGYYWVQPRDSKSEGFYTPVNYVDFAGIAPAGATISSVLDYAKWIQALLEAARSTTGSDENSEPSNNLIDSELFKELTSARIPEALPFIQQSHLGNTSWGLGWHVHSALSGPRHPMINHSGGLTGYGTMLYVLPNDSFGVVTMGNSALIANFIGAVLSQELMARKLNIKDPGQEEQLRDFNMIMQAQLAGIRHMIGASPDAGSDEDTLAIFKNTDPTIKKQIVGTDFIPSKDQDISALQQLEGIYTNAAYGSVRISVNEPISASTESPQATIDRSKICPHSLRNTSLNTAKDTVRESVQSLVVEYVGQRCWRNIYLLHPRNLPTQTRNTSANLTFFDLENLIKHGDLNNDVIPGLPNGAEGGVDGTGLCRSAIYYESTAWTPLGAVFAQDGNGKMRVGLALGNTSASMDGTSDKWEEGKVWFNKDT